MSAPASVYLALAGQVLISGTTYVVAKHAVGSFAPLEVMLLRFAATVPLFALLLRSLPPPRLPRGRQWLAAAGLGLLGLPLNQGFFLTGLERSTPTHASLLYALAPLLVFVLSARLRRERATAPKLAGILVALAGTIVVLGDRGLADAAQVRAGDALIALGVLSWALYSVLGRPLAVELGGTRVTCWTALAGSLLALPLAPAVVEPARLAAASAGAWLAVGFLSLFTSFASYLLWYFALERAEASRVSVWTNLQPVLTAALAWLAYGTPITAAFAGGAALVIAGVALAQRG